MKLKTGWMGPLLLLATLAAVLAAGLLMPSVRPLQIATPAYKLVVFQPRLVWSGLAAVASPTEGVNFQTTGGDTWVIGDSYSLAGDKTLRGNLFIVGGTGVLEAGSIVKGDVMMMGGTLRASGTIGGSINAIGGLVELNEQTVVEGDVNLLAGKLVGSDLARIDGAINTDATKPFPLVVPQPVTVGRPAMTVDFNPFADGLWLLFRSVLWSALAALVLLFAPQNTRRVAQAAMQQPLISGGLGLMTLAVAPLVLLILAITLICSPLALLGLILCGAAWAHGLVALGLEAGQRVAQLFKQDWAPAVSASVGVFLLTLIGNSIGWLVPCVGWLAPALVGAVGLGAVMLTRFGQQDYTGGQRTLGDLSPSEPPAPPEEPAS